MAIIIDRRLNQSGKNRINRKRFLDRAKQQIKDAVKKSVSDKDIKDIGSGEDVKIRPKDINEPTFHNDTRSGIRDHVLPGNKTFNEGDLIEKGKGGSGKGQVNKAGEGDGMDDFTFTLTREEFLNYLFEDLELPDFVKATLQVVDNLKYNRAGFSNSGSPANLNVLRTFKKSIGRRLALGRPEDEEVAEAHRAWLEALEKEIPTHELDVLYDEWKALEARQKQVPFIEENDLRYNFYAPKPTPAAQAVMFCIMDVSGSMGEREKDISKRFFLLLYLFLERKYDKIDIRFIRHTEVAEEVDEQTFFYDRKSGGTKISSALEMVDEIIVQEYPLKDWNVYIAQCTDGDNWSGDNDACQEIIENRLLKKVQYYAYIQVAQYDRSGGLFSGWSAWPLFEGLSKSYKKIVCKQIFNQNEVWSVFANLFRKQ